MKQLTIYCSEELNDTVNKILHNYEIEGFIHMPGIFGEKFKPKDSFGKDLVWQACAFVVFPGEDQIESILNELQEYANRCKDKPCLRMVVTPIDKLY